MSAFVLAVLRVGFLALIWVFIGLVGAAVRTDIFGQRVDAQGRTLRGRRARKAAKARKAQAAGAEPTPALPHRLVVAEGRANNTEFPLRGVITLGRAATQTVVIDDDFSSGRHAQLTPAGDGTWVVEDLASTNGTYVNGTRITLPTRVSTDDVVRIGRTQLRLES